MEMIEKSEVVKNVAKNDLTLFDILYIVSRYFLVFLLLLLFCLSIILQIVYDGEEKKKKSSFYLSYHN
jgi:hypothetical protein